MDCTQAFEGPVVLRRKLLWVRRIARVENGEFSYRNAANDKLPKMIVVLSKARIEV